MVLYLWWPLAEVMDSSQLDNRSHIKGPSWSQQVGSQAFAPEDGPDVTVITPSEACDATESKSHPRQVGNQQFQERRPC